MGLGLRGGLSLADNPLRFNNFRFFIIGHFLSFTGSWVYNTAVTWLVYDLTRSSLYLGIFSLANSIPAILVTLLSGFIIDCFDRKKLMSFLLFLSVPPSLLLGILTQSSFVNFTYVLFLSLIASSISAIDAPLRQVFISEIVPSNYLTKALSFQALSFNLARMLGPFIAGIILSQTNIWACFYLNALSYVPFFLFVTFFIKPQFSHKHLIRGGGTFVGSVTELFKFLKTNRNVLSVILAISNFTFFGASLMILFPVIVDKVYGGGGKEYGFLSSMVGVGAILGAIYVILKRDLQDKLLNLLVATFIFCAGILGVAFSENWVLTLVACFLIGCSFTNLYPIANSYIQEHTPSELRGRVISFFTLSFIGVHPLGGFLVGILAASFSLKLIFLCYTAFVVFGNLYLIRLAKIKKIEKNNV